MKEGFICSIVLSFIGPCLAHEVASPLHFWLVSLKLPSSQEAAGEAIPHDPPHEPSSECRSKQQDTKGLGPGGQAAVVESGRCQRQSLPWELDT